MKKIESWEEYNSYLSKLRDRGGHYINNSMLMQKAAERFIEQGRLLCMECNNGVLFFKDEIEYYDLVFYLEETDEFPEIDSDKPVVVRYVEREGRKTEDGNIIEKWMKQAGYAPPKQYYNVQGDPERTLEMINTMASQAERFLKRFGIEIGAPDRSMFENIRKMQYEIASIPFFDIEYRTDEEMEEDAQNGYLLVAVNQKTGELCGANYSVLSGRYVTGWLAVRDDFRGIPGISICLHKKAMERDLQNGHKKKTWIAVDNKESIDYHKRIGYEYVGAKMYVWVSCD